MIEWNVEALESKSDDKRKSEQVQEYTGSQTERHIKKLKKEEKEKLKSLESQEKVDVNENQAEPPKPTNDKDIFYCCNHAEPCLVDATKVFEHKYNTAIMCPLKKECGICGDSRHLRTRCIKQGVTDEERLKFVCQPGIPKEKQKFVLEKYQQWKKRREAKQDAGKNGHYGPTTASVDMKAVVKK